MGWLLALLAVVAAGVLIAREDLGFAGLSGGQLAAAVVMLAFLLAISASLLSAYRGRFLTAARDMVVWVAIAFGLVAGYSYREELAQLTYRVRGELAPPGSPVTVEGQRTGEQSVRIRRRNDGHFIANTVVNGSSMTMLVDTGASTVVLRQSDAARLGIDLSRLSYSVPVQTANGVTHAAHVRLASVTVGSIRIEGIEALVAKPGALRENLLGMTFLSRLRSYEFSGEFLTLRS